MTEQRGALANITCQVSSLSVWVAGSFIRATLAMRIKCVCIRTNASSAYARDPMLLVVDALQHLDPAPKSRPPAGMHLPGKSDLAGWGEDLLPCGRKRE